jgi:CBS-domain-containing membrane protein
MARSFRWGPFLPVRPEDTLLHVLLLLSKHRLKAVPVVDVESSNSRVKGFITQVSLFVEKHHEVYLHIES